MLLTEHVLVETLLCSLNIVLKLSKTATVYFQWPLVHIVNKLCLLPIIIFSSHSRKYSTISIIYLQSSDIHWSHCTEVQLPSMSLSKNTFKEQMGLFVDSYSCFQVLCFTISIFKNTNLENSVQWMSTTCHPLLSSIQSSLKKGPTG